MEPYIFDTYCPYCGEWLDIDHSNGQGYDPTKCERQKCSYCGKTFEYYVEVTYHYTPYKVPCIDDESLHKWMVRQNNGLYPFKDQLLMQCTQCRTVREFTKEEKEVYDGEK